MHIAWRTVARPFIPGARSNQKAVMHDHCIC